MWRTGLSAGQWKQGDQLGGRGSGRGDRWWGWDQPGGRKGGERTQILDLFWRWSQQDLANGFM